MLNTITVVGNLGNDPESRVSPSGTEIATFSIAVKNQGKDEGTTWFRCIAFGKTAQTASQYLKKGSMAGVTGRMESRKYTDRADVEREAWEVKVSDLRLGPKREGGGSRDPWGDAAHDDAPF